MEMESYSTYARNMNSMKILELLIRFVRDVCHIIYIDKYRNIMNIYIYIYIYIYDIKVLQYTVHIDFIYWNSFGYDYMYEFFSYH